MKLDQSVAIRSESPDVNLETQPDINLVRNKSPISLNFEWISSGWKMPQGWTGCFRTQLRVGGGLALVGRGDTRNGLRSTSSVFQNNTIRKRDRNNQEEVLVVFWKAVEQARNPVARSSSNFRKVGTLVSAVLWLSRFTRSVNSLWRVLV